MTYDLTRRRFMGTAAAGAGALSFVGAPTARAQATGTLTFALSSYPPSFAPLQSAGTAAGTVKLLIHRGLLSYDKDGALRGELAEEWGVDDAGVWNFTLREGATWHDGRPVTSTDVRYTIERGAAEESAAAYKTFLQGISEVETPDDRTVRLRFAEPTATAETVLAHYNMPIVPEGSDEEALIGAGPFKLEERERGVSLDLVANEAFYRPGLPKLAGIRLVAYADENLRVAALEAGDVDLIEYVPWQAMDSIEGDDGLTLQTVEGPFMYLTFNGARPPFDDARVRRAVTHAIRRQDIVDATFFGRGAPLAHLPISVASPFYVPEHADAWAYDPEAAKRLLAEAGHPDGFECTMLSDGAVRDAHLHGRDRAGLPVDDRHPGSARPARLGHPGPAGQRRAVRPRRDGHERRQQRPRRHCQRRRHELTHLIRAQRQPRPARDRCALRRGPGHLRRGGAR